MSSEALIVKRVQGSSPEDPSAGSSAVSIEPSLLPASRRLLRDFPLASLQGKYVHFLEQRVQRNPRDLQAHVERVLQYHDLDDNEGAYAAIVDLFLILGASGQPLRRRLLTLIADQLSGDRYEYLAMHLETGLHSNEAPGGIRRSKLSKQVTGTTRIVVRRQPGVDDPGDPLSLARESIEHGRHALAQSLLEGALNDDPGQPDVCRELLALYKRHGLRADFFRTYTSALGRRLACPELWEQTAAYFEAAESGQSTEYE